MAMAAAPSCPSPSSPAASFTADPNPLSSSTSQSFLPHRRCPESLPGALVSNAPFLHQQSQLSGRRPRPLRVRSAAGAGYYPASITWWKKGDQQNMRDINSAQEFSDALKNAGEKVVLVDFYSAGCRSCKALYPKICQIAAENPDIAVLKVNFYENVELCRSLGVSMMPFFHIYRGADQNLVDAFSCSLSRINKLREAVAKYKGNHHINVISVADTNSRPSEALVMHPAPVL